MMLIMLLMTFTSFMYFFVHFSIDANMAELKSLHTLTEDQQAFYNALTSNTTLAATILFSFILLTGFVLTIFYSRFIKQNRKEIGTIKNLGYHDSAISKIFIIFTAEITLIGATIGIVLGYFVSVVLLNAYQESYLVTDVKRGIGISTFMTGIFLPMLVFCLIAYFCLGSVRKKETGKLIASSHETGTMTPMLKFADVVANLFPEKQRFSVRLSLRNPIAVVLIILAVICFSVMFLLAYSLNISSQTVYKSQTQGHYYNYEYSFDKIQTAKVDGENTTTYLKTNAILMSKNDKIDWIVVAVHENRSLFELFDKNGNAIEYPKPGEIVISAQLQELYGLNKGDVIEAAAGEDNLSLAITDVAFNATVRWVYASEQDVSELCSVKEDDYNGIYSASLISERAVKTSRAMKLDALERGAVSNRMSAVINQATGCLIGCIVLFLALLIHFQSSTRNMLILYLMGYQVKQIRKMLVDIYRPILWISFALTLWPSILIVKMVLRSLSIQIGDYMPFHTNVWLIILVFLLLNLIYILVQSTFRFGIRRVILTESYAEYTG